MLLLVQVLGMMAARRQALKPQEIALTLHNISKLDDPPEESIKVSAPVERSQH